MDQPMITPKPFNEWDKVQGYTDAELWALIQETENVGMHLGSMVSLPMRATLRRLLLEKGSTPP